MFYTIAFVVAKAITILKMRKCVNKDYTVIALPTCKPIA